MSALAGIRVLEFADGWSGAAIAGRLLAELGATVIKVEPPEGDSLRRRPPLLDGTSVAFDLLAAGKASVVLDWQQVPDARDSVLEIAGTCDVVIDGLANGVLSSVGLGVDVVRRRRDDVVWCDVTTFGRDSPMAGAPGGELVAQAMSGFMTTTGFADAPPTSAGVPLGEHAAAVFGVTGILAALLHRDATSEGQEIDIASVDCLAYFLSSFLPAVFVGGSVPNRQGFRHPLMAPWDAYDANGGKVVICTGSEAHWHSMLRMMRRDDLIDSERYGTVERRVEHVDEVNGIIERWIGDLLPAEAVAKLHAIGVPAGPILHLDEVFTHPQFRARGLASELEDSGRRVVTLGSVYKMSATPGHVARTAPALGGGVSVPEGDR